MRLKSRLYSLRQMKQRLERNVIHTGNQETRLDHRIATVWQ